MVSEYMHMYTYTCEPQGKLQVVVLFCFLHGMSSGIMTSSIVLVYSDGVTHLLSQHNVYDSMYTMYVYVQCV